MIRAMFFKEICKIRWMMLMLCLVNISVCIYITITTRRLFILDHPEIVWYRVLHLGQIHYGDFKFLPLFSGAAVSFIQYLPEMWQQRLRLSLHLPVSTGKMIFIHVGIGLTAYCLAVLPDGMALIWMTTHFFPAEAVGTTCLTACPWFLAGVAAYLGGTLVLLEPNLECKAYNMIVAVGVAGLYLYSTFPGGYAKTLAMMLLPLVLMGLSVLLPAYRFRYRRMT